MRISQSLVNTKKHFEFEIKPQMSYIAVECSGLGCVVVRFSLREQICGQRRGLVLLLLLMVH